MFSTEFCDEGYVVSSVDVGLYLRDKLLESNGDSIPCVVVTVEYDVDNDVDKYIAHVTTVKDVCIVKDVGKGSSFERGDDVGEGTGG